MRMLVITTLLLLCGQEVLGWSTAKLMQASRMIAKTRRDPIQMPTQTPMVPYKPPGSEYTQFMDVFSRMYRDRIMFVGKYIDDNSANEIISQILYLAHDDPRADIEIYFNCPGGQLRPALAIYDLLCQTTKDLDKRCKISTVNLGMCAGMASILCGAGTKGHRAALPNARFLLQRTGLDQPFRGQASDIGLEVQNLKKWNDRMEGELSQITGQTVEQIRSDLKRDFYLSADEAVRYGLIDRVLPPSFNKRVAQGDNIMLGPVRRADGGWDMKPENGEQQEQPQRREDEDDDYDGPKVSKGG